MADLHRPTWLITGCDKGMGLAMAEAALARGHNVAVTVLDRAAISPLTQAYPETCRVYHLDVTKPAETAATVARVASDFGTIDVLVNNAGYGLVGAAEESSPEEYRRLFEVNFFGLVETTRAVLGVMRRQRRGHVINFSSLVGIVGFTGMSYYSASKFAVEGYSESLAKEAASLGIRVTIIEPGGFRSDFAGGSLAVSKTEIEDYAETAGATRAALKVRHGTQPGDPAKLARVVVDIAALPDPPLRLPLGPDAWQQVSEKASRLAAELERWKSTSHSTSFDEPSPAS